VPDQLLCVARARIGQLFGPQDLSRPTRPRRQRATDVLRTEHRPFLQDQHRQLERRVAGVIGRVARGQVVDRIERAGDIQLLREHAREPGEVGAAAADEAGLVGHGGIRWGRAPPM